MRTRRLRRHGQRSRRNARALRFRTSSMARSPPSVRARLRRCGSRHPSLHRPRRFERQSRSGRKCSRRRQRRQRRLDQLLLEQNGRPWSCRMSGSALLRRDNRWSWTLLLGLLPPLGYRALLVSLRPLLPRGRLRFRRVKLLLARKSSLCRSLRRSSRGLKQPIWSVLPLFGLDESSSPPMRLRRRQTLQRRKQRLSSRPSRRDRLPISLKLSLGTWRAGCCSTS